VPIRPYGVLTAKVVDRRRENTTDTPHFQLDLDDGATRYRAAINVMSAQAPSELLFLADEDFRHPVTAAVAALGGGWHALPSQPNGAALDYVRGNLFDPAKMRALPPDVTGPDNDLADFLEHYVQRAMADASASASVFGQRWGPEDGKDDKIFHFSPGNGVHDCHMNQGNAGRFKGDNGIWQDGGLLIHLPGERRWIGVFLAFQSQTWHTDDTTGNAITDQPGTAPVAAAEAPVRIVAAMVNPLGPAPEHERVLVLNASPRAVDLDGWKIADKTKRTCPVGTTTLGPGETLSVTPSGGVALSNNGGQITLLDPNGLKVDGVAYTADQAHREGWTVTF
jgi:uncharacterized protein YukJ